LKGRIDTFMSNISSVTGAFSELRSQCEQLIRSITKAERLVLDSNGGDAGLQSETKTQLATEFAIIMEAHAVIGEALTDCDRAISQLASDVAPASDRQQLELPDPA
jgi:hypothetical protein